MTGLDRLGIPVFQAIRPMARALSVSQGKGLTPLAAKVSALLEACEFDAAERLAPPSVTATPRELGEDVPAIWCDGPRTDGGCTLDPDRTRHWLRARNLTSGGETWVPWDLVSLDFTRSPRPDAAASSDGLATGNGLIEATVGALAELLERATSAQWRALGPRDQRALELDVASIDAPLARAVLDRFAARGCRARVWSMGQAIGLPSFSCVLTDAEVGEGSLPPVEGSGCHPDREIALLRSLLEAAQVRVTLIAGARDDLVAQDYGAAIERTSASLLSTLSFGPGPLAWSAVQTPSSMGGEGDLDCLLAAAARLTSLPVLACELPPIAPGLTTIKLLAPGLAIDELRTIVPAPSLPATPRIGGRDRGRLLFAGPSIAGLAIPPGIDLRAPAVCGDLAALRDDPPAVIGLIDGAFETAPTVWHKEILDLLARGVTVVGGASLGAIRAAELAAFGMVGVGAVFAAYRDGAIARDDAVMVVHAPVELGGVPLSVALVDAEAALARIDMAPAERRMLQRIVRTLDFRTRTWRTCLELFARRTGRTASVGEDALVRAATLKREDAAAVIDALLAAPPSGSPRQAPPMSCYYRDLLERTASAPS